MVQKPSSLKNEQNKSKPTHKSLSQSREARYASILATLTFIAHPSSLEELLGGIVERLTDLIEFDFCALVLNKPGKKSCQITPLLNCNGNGISVERDLPQNESSIVQFMDGSDIFSILDTDDINDESLQSSTPLTNLLYIRLSANEKPIGVLIVGTSDSYQYCAEDIDVGLMISNHLALAIDHLQQISELRTVTTALKSEVSERERAEETMKCIVEGTGAEIGTTFFKSVVQHMASAIGARYAFVGELVDNGMSVKTIAVWRGESLIEDFSYSIEGATGDACKDKICYCCHSVTKLLPSAEMQKMMRVESCWGLPLNNSSNETVGVLVVMHDAPMEQEDHIIPIMKIFAARSGPELERIHMEADLFNEKERAQVTVASIGDGVITTDERGIIDYINPVAEELTGWITQQAHGAPLKNVYSVIDETSREPIADQLESALKGEISTPSADQVVLLRKDGEEFPIANTMSPIYDRGKNIVGCVVVFSDVSELRRLMNKMTYQASHDALTGLVNRREFEARLHGLVDTAEYEDKQHALCYIDLDRFKIVNDTAGHVAGDELLKQVSANIQSFVRDNDTVARLGGDEFAVFLQGCPIDNAEVIAEKIRKAVKELNFVWEGQAFEIGASIGLVPITKESGGLSKILSTADSACYVAKERGRNYVYVHRQNDIALAKHSGEMKWVQEIRRGLENDNFCLYFQKILPLSGPDNTAEYFEVLVRLIGADGKVIPPMAFIPAAERYSLMPEIDCWVIEKTFSILANGKNNSTKNFGHCSINLSGQSLGDDNVLNHIIFKAKEYNISPATICFEITETSAIANILQAKQFMTKLSKAGFSFALDDFGSGLSSFSYLKNLPVDYLKIDGEFVKDIVNNEIDYTMVDAINRIGHAMGIKTVAEYVENTDILIKLHDIGVDFAQGYGISEPEPLIENDPIMNADDESVMSDKKTNNGTLV